MPEKIVIALGGNALQSKNSAPTAEGQLEVVRQTSEYLAQISQRGYEMAVVHGNGPQVGRILLASETAREVVPAMPFDVCGAMSQGYIGYHIQQSLKYALNKRNRNIPVVTLATQVVVDRADPAFQNPSKPIGPFYTQEAGAGGRLHPAGGRRPGLAAGGSLPPAPADRGDRSGKAAVGPRYRHHLRRRRHPCGGES